MKAAQREFSLSELRELFESIVPGFFDAWREARSACRDTWEARQPHPNRVYANHHERLLTVYQAEIRPAHRGRAQTRDCLSLSDSHILFYNRGYVPIFAARFPAADESWASLEVMDVRGHDQEEWDGWFTNDSTPLVQRWKATRAVIEYVRANATEITPVWQKNHGRALARSS